ncbi:MAG: carbohydrate-binding protein [Nitrosomonadaceae bacterium]
MRSNLSTLPLVLFGGLLFLMPFPANAAGYVRLTATARTSQFTVADHEEFKASSDMNIPENAAVTAFDRSGYREAFASASISRLFTQASAKASGLNVTDAGASCMSIQITFIDNDRFRRLLGNQSKLPLNLKLEYKSEVFIPKPLKWPEQGYVSSWASITVVSFQQAATRHGRTYWLRSYLDQGPSSPTREDLFEYLGNAEEVPITITPQSLTVRIAASASSSAWSWVDGPRAYSRTTVELGNILLPDGQPADLDYTLDHVYPPTLIDKTRNFLSKTLIESMKDALDISNNLTVAKSAAGLALKNPALLVSQVIDIAAGILMKMGLDYSEDIVEPEGPLNQMPMLSTQKVHSNFPGYRSLSSPDESQDANNISDPNYYLFATVNTPSVLLPGLDEYEPEDALLLQESTDLKLEFAATLQAMVLTIQRNKAAVDANDLTWAERQDLYILYLIHKLHWITKEIVKVHNQITWLLNKYPVHFQQISMADVESFQQDLLMNGLPEFERDILNLFGLPEQDVQDEIEALASADLSEMLPIDIASIYSEDIMHQDLLAALAVFVGDANNTDIPDINDFHAIPGKIEAENYIQMHGIQTVTTTDSGGGLIVGWMDNGDWLDYAVNVEESGLYSVDLRVARLLDFPEGQGCLKIGDETLACFSVPGTGDWQNWVTVTTQVSLEAGEQTLRLYVDEGGWNINWMEFK